MRALLILALLPATLLAQDDATNAKLAEKLKQRKIARFFKRIEANENLDAATRTKLLALKEGAILGGEYGCIHQALLTLHPDYRRADAMLLNERFAAAADAFKKLQDTDDEYLKAYAKFRYGLAQMNRDKFEESAQIFTEVLNDYGRYVGCDIEAAFYRVVCLGQEREKEQAITAATQFLRDYPDAPERYRAAMEQIKNELVQEWESPLYDLAGRMSKVARQIEEGDTGDSTQGQQKEIVEIIDELIKRAEQQENQGNQQQKGGSGKPRGNDPSSSPAKESAVSPGASRVGDLRPKPKPKPGDAWGQMRDKEREEVLQALKDKFPDRYKELLEQYYKQLAEGKRVTEAQDR
jgi:TolA-binding protein